VFGSRGATKGRGGSEAGGVLGGRSYQPPRVRLLLVLMRLLLRGLYSQVATSGLVSLTRGGMLSCRKSRRISTSRRRHLLRWYVRSPSLDFRVFSWIKSFVYARPARSRVSAGRFESRPAEPMGLGPPTGRQTAVLRPPKNCDQSPPLCCLPAGWGPKPHGFCRPRFKSAGGYLGLQNPWGLGPQPAGRQQRGGLWSQFFGGRKTYGEGLDPGAGWGPKPHGFCRPRFKSAGGYPRPGGAGINGRPDSGRVLHGHCQVSRLCPPRQVAGIRRPI
jgi:hypothetical protein